MGFGGGNNQAQQQAAQDEAQRQAQIKQSTGAINALFDDPARKGQYDQLAKDTTAYYTSDLDRQNAVAQRKLKFALGRSGQAGGSTQYDQAKVLGQDYDKGLLEASRRGEQASANLQGQDESQRQSLLAMAEAGLDTTTASSEASSALRSNLQSSQADATANAFGDLFGDVNSLYNTSQDAAALRRGQLYGYGSLFSPVFGVGQQQATGGLY
jgi:hypothetical protein